MGFNIISAAEAASYVKHGYNIGLSGFTPAGTPKAVTPEIAKLQKKSMPKVIRSKLVFYRCFHRRCHRWDSVKSKSYSLSRPLYHKS